MGSDTRFRFFHLAALLHMRNRIVNQQRECPNGLIVEMLQSTWRRACVQYCVSPVSIHVFIDYSHDIKVELDFSAQMITTLKQNPPKKTINQKLWWIKFMRRNGIPCVCVWLWERNEEVAWYSMHIGLHTQLYPSQSFRTEREKGQMCFEFNSLFHTAAVADIPVVFLFCFFHVCNLI